MILFLLIWPGMAAGFVALFTSTVLGWRLFFFVPLAAEVVLYLGPASQGGFVEYLTGDPSNLTSVPIIYIVGLVLFGWQATILGELAWLVVRWLELPKRVTSKYQLLIGVLCGAAFAMLYQFASAWLLSKTAALSGVDDWGKVWLAAYGAGGAVGGLLVAYYAVKEFGHGPHDAKDEAAETLTSRAAGAGV